MGLLSQQAFCLLIPWISLLSSSVVASTLTCSTQFRNCHHDVTCDVSLNLVTALCPPLVAGPDACPRLCALALVALLQTGGAWGRGSGFLDCTDCAAGHRCRQTSSALSNCLPQVTRVQSALVQPLTSPVDCALAVLLCHANRLCRILLSIAVPACKDRPPGCNGPHRDCARRLDALLKMEKNYGALPLTCYCSGLPTASGGCGESLYGAGADAVPAVAPLTLESHKVEQVRHLTSVALSHVGMVSKDGTCRRFQATMARTPTREQCPPPPGGRSRRSRVQVPTPTPGPTCYFLGLTSGAVTVAETTWLTTTAAVLLLRDLVSA